MNPVQYSMTLTDSGEWLQVGFAFDFIKKIGNIDQICS